MLPGFILGIVLHEVAHGYLAYRLGDPTAKMAGRLTLNPLKHLDLWGSLVFIITALGGMGFGWAKPVPVDYRYFKNLRTGMRLVSVAGPATNFALALLFVLLLKLALAVATGEGARAVVLMFFFGAQINLVLMVLNLLPIPPLDGGHILSSFLPPAQAQTLERLAPMGMILVVILLMLGLLSWLFSGTIEWFFNLCLSNREVAILVQMLSLIRGGG
jgi:Zn-dependent protease